MKLEIRSGVTNDRLRDLLRRNGSPTSGNKDRLTYAAATLILAGQIFERKDAALISHCMGCVRSWREETKAAARLKLDPNWNGERFWQQQEQAAKLDEHLRLLDRDGEMATGRALEGSPAKLEKLAEDRGKAIASRLDEGTVLTRSEGDDLFAYLRSGR